jgi:HPt (histidine-containing phosphotransfer) domain-containing protein
MNEFIDRMAGLRARYIARLACDLAAMDALLTDRPTAAALVELQERAHKLAGISGSFGFPTIGEAAKALDCVWTHSPEDIRRAQDLMAGLRCAACATKGTPVGSHF